MTTPELVQAQRTYFETGATRSADFRLAALKKLQAAVQANERALAEAMAGDREQKLQLIEDCNAQIAALREYGLATGLAFQIQDDLLNIEGDPEIVGKDYASDITEGKRTLMVVHALKHSDKRDRLVEILSSKTTDIAELAEAVSIMREAGSLDYARDYASSLTDKAKEKLLQEIDESNARALLISMADYFINRMK